MKAICLTALLTFFVITNCFSLGMSIYVGNNWNVTVDSSDLLGGPGTNIPSSFESASDHLDITILFADGKSWRVDQRRSDAVWHNDLTLSARRTANGTGGGSISGGTAYQEIETSDRSFFNGNENRFGIKVQMRLEGVSINIPAATYITTVTYTIVEL